MTLLVDIYNSWNEKQRTFYLTLLKCLQDIHITTAEALCMRHIDELFEETKIPKQIIKAFIKQVIYDYPTESTSTLSRVYISTGFDCVDKLFSLPSGKEDHQQGISTHHVIELCGTVNSYVSMIMANILSSFILQQNNKLDNIYIYDTASGMLSPKTITTTFIKRGIEPDLVTQIESQQLLGAAKNLVDSLENLIALSFSNGLIVIDDLSFLINYDWSNNILKEIVQQVKILTKRAGCIVLFLRDTTINQTVSKMELFWNPMIDTRLNFYSDGTVEMTKSRHQLIGNSTSCTITSNR